MGALPHCIRSYPRELFHLLESRSEPKEKPEGRLTGHEDQGTLKRQGGGSTLALLPLSGPHGLLSVSSLASLELHKKSPTKTGRQETFIISRHLEIGFKRFQCVCGAVGAYSKWWFPPPVSLPSICQDTQEQPGSGPGVASAPTQRILSHPGAPLSRTVLVLASPTTLLPSPLPLANLIQQSSGAQWLDP